MNLSQHQGEDLGKDLGVQFADQGILSINKKYGVDSG